MAKREAISVKKRFEILTRDSYACQYCGRPAPTVQLVVDHVIPVAEGGNNEDFNLVTACNECNQGKSATLHDRMEFRAIFRDLWMEGCKDFKGDEDFDGPLEWARVFIGASFSRVRFWCEPDVHYLQCVVDGLLKAATGQDYRLFTTIGFPEDDPDSIRMLASFVLSCLGPAPAIIAIVHAGITPEEPKRLEQVVREWTSMVMPILKRSSDIEPTEAIN